MAKKRVSDLLALGLLLVSTGYIATLIKLSSSLSSWLIGIGWTVVFVTQVYFLWKTWFRNNG